MLTKQTVSIIGAVLLAGSLLVAQGPQGNAKGKTKNAVKAAPRDPNQSPASQPRLKSATPQTYTAEQIQTGELRFGAQCGFCHGRDATGGESGPDLTRSELVAEDVRGDKVGPLLKTGREEMPAFQLSDTEQIAIVAFLHKQMDDFSALGGGRRSVDPEDLATGNAADGRAYFNGAGGCSGCHSGTGDLAGIASRYQGLTLLQRMLYPSAGGRPAPAPPKAVFTLNSGQTIVAPLAGEDEFSVTVLDPLGAQQTYSKSAVKVRIDNPVSAHFDQLGKYTDAAMHNVYAYLSTLK